MGLKWLVKQAEAVPAHGWALVVEHSGQLFKWWVSHRIRRPAPGYGWHVRDQGTSRSLTAAQRAAERAYKSIMGVKR